MDSGDQDARENPEEGETGTIEVLSWRRGVEEELGLLVWMVDTA